MNENIALKAETELKRVCSVLPQKLVAESLSRSPRTIRRWLEGTVEVDPLIIPALQSTWPPERQIQNPRFTFIDLFAGIGGLRGGFEATGGACVFTSEWNKYACKTYQANFGTSERIAGDITQVEIKDIPDHDVLLAGFPCQPFSIAGVSKKNSMGRAHGFLDKTQGTLFFNVASIIEQKQPKVFVLENVKNLRSHNNGETFAVILEVLQGLGYSIHYKVIDAAHWVPQHRERICIIGYRKACNFSWDALQLPETKPTLGSILHRPDEEVEAPYTRCFRGKTIAADKYTLTPHMWEYLQKYAEKHRQQGNGFGFGLFSENDVARTLSSRYYKDGSEILISRGKGKIPRRLTPRECARLMGFDTAGNRMTIPVSDSQAYKQFGNSVVVPMVKAVAEITIAAWEAQLNGWAKRSN